MQMSWDTVYSWSQFLVVFFAGVALVSGLVVNKRQAKQLLMLETALEEQRGKNLELQKLITEQRVPADVERARSILLKGPKGTVSIVHVDSREAQIFALMIYGLLEGTGWNVATPRAKSPSSLDDFSVVGVELKFGEWPTDADGKPIFAGPGKSLLEALTVGLPPPFRPMPANLSRKDELVIVVGAKY